MCDLCLGELPLRLFDRGTFQTLAVSELVKKPPHLGRGQGGLNTSQSSMQAPHACLKER